MVALSTDPFDPFGPLDGDNHTMVMVANIPGVQFRTSAQVVEVIIPHLGIAVSAVSREAACEAVLAAIKKNAAKAS